MRVTSIDPKRENSSLQPTIHFEGITTGGSSDSRVQGFISDEGDGVIHWHLGSILGNTGRWQTYGAQIGGVQSAAVIHVSHTLRQNRADCCHRVGSAAGVVLIVASGILRGRTGLTRLDDRNWRGLPSLSNLFSSCKPVYVRPNCILFAELIPAVRAVAFQFNSSEQTIYITNTK